jgi:hypothetical protein
VSDMISTDLKAVMRRLRLGKLIDTLPERLALARQQKMPHQDFLFGLLSDECQRRDSAASTLRSERALLDPEMLLERWDPTAKVTYDEALLAELVSLHFIEAHRHAAIVGPVGVGRRSSRTHSVTSHVVVASMCLCFVLIAYSNC